MMLLPSAQEISRFRTKIVELMGLNFDESKFDILAKVLHSRMLANGMEHTPYIDSLDTRSSEEIRLLARELTVTETYFLRNIDQFNAFAEVALPERLAVHDGNRNIEVLSAGCASGEEPYSLAITVREHCSYAADRISITAFDLNPAMLQKAAQARYSNWSLRDLSDELKKRWFKVGGDAFNLNDAIRKSVVFESRNLTQDGADFWSPARFDVVFCRNVLMYFSNDQAQAAVDRIARAMAPGGYLFLGHAETLRGISNDFHLRHSHDTFYYQRKEHIVSSHVRLPQLQPRVRWKPAASLSADTSWIEAIQRASDRIQALTPAVEVAMFDNAIYVGDRPMPDLHRVLESLHSERYDRSLDQIGNLPVQHAHDPDVLLLKAVSLIHSGALAEAEVVCEELLKCDEFNAGAHYVLALCREGAGDLDGAVEHDQTATYLDPKFAMPRLHLGLVSRRQGEHDSARKDLGLALLLLQHEDASRVLLFGGGFKREALLALCRAELAALGENK
ncbi:CheR family methyltransferase [Solimicrobium silvestre]|uniref:CheR methyltransferase, SAM binding domain n=1 Tax=Solimicrobium silvestre TaxID=2099400 RepID=A0A2S9H5D4_9BURK|nr:protein-glutamate O-methyltransferase CheR [Solimicrobium silvestre]PRC95177.1 CheR methyltransferase, SAM binding domain [Solimicrobium silvestre]